LRRISINLFVGKQRPPTGKSSLSRINWIKRSRSTISLGKSMSSSKNSKKKQVRGLDPRRHRSEYYWNKANSEDSSSEESTLKEGTMMQKWRKRPWGARRLWWLQTKPRSLPRANPKSCRCKQRAAIRPKKQMERTMIEQQCQEEATYQIMTRSDKYFLMLKGMSNSNMALCHTFSE
jgi:hypothetical protein